MGVPGKADRALYATIPESVSERIAGLVVRLQVNDTFGYAEKPARVWRVRKGVGGVGADW